MKSNSVSRRSFLTAGAGGAAAFQIIRPELVRGFADEKLKAGLVGCGGRGTQAMENILTGTSNVEITALADVFEDRMESSIRKTRALPPQLSSRFKVEPDHRFIGFDAYKKLINSDVDIIMLATNPAYRPMHFEAAVEAKKHIFCEKPMGTDPTGVRRYMAAAKKSQELKLTVKSGAQRRSHPAYLDEYKKLKNGDYGDIVHMNAYWVGTPVLNFKNNPLFPGGKRNPAWATSNSSSATGTASSGSAAIRSWSSTCTISIPATGSWVRIRWRWSPAAARHGVRAKRSTATSTTTWARTLSIRTACTCRAIAGSTPDRAWRRTSASASSGPRV